MARRILKLCTLLPPSAADPSSIPADPEEDRGALNTIRRWPNGSVLTVHFLEGDPAVHKRVIPIAQEWSQYANIQFEFVDDPKAKLRVAFNPRAGSWSYMGNDCLLPALAGKPTMNLGWLKPNTAEKEYRRVVLHEFGHALGLIHEHLSPKATIPWNAQAVIEYYRRTNGWDEAYTRSNVLTPLPADEYTRFDPQSIMLYPVPKELTVGGFEIPWDNNELSESDKTFIAKIYPFPKA